MEATLFQLRHFRQDFVFLYTGKRLWLGSIGRLEGLKLDDNVRRTERVTLRADIDIRRPGDHRYRVNILDFSPEGCRVEVPIVVDEGDSIFIALPGLETIEGKVRWRKEWLVGIEFVRPLYPAVFDMMKKKMAQI